MLLSPLGKGRGPSFEQISFLLLHLRNALYQIWLKLPQWFWRRKRKYENVQQWRPQQQRRRTTDKLWLEKLTWTFGSGELISIQLKKKNKYKKSSEINDFHVTQCYVYQGLLSSSLSRWAVTVFFSNVCNQLNTTWSSEIKFTLASLKWRRWNE